MSYFLIEEDIRDICYQYAKTHLTHDEPLPSFDTRYPDKLDAVLAAPQRELSGKFVYPTIEIQAAVLFYEIVKQHPFLNGNKRMACVSLMVFLSLNDMWLKVSWRELYDVAVTVASSKTENRDGMLQLLIGLIKNNSFQEK
ncbi:MAG: type II toxin-antitoxin system death-on-curing family toxin [Candidatus Kerfeldbacteria bacterium]|nr:type II toxin-antitoxin system death-on-curing family toxin [Candidatus Kerfeldbacteria bacterium]